MSRLDEVDYIFSGGKRQTDREREEKLAGVWERNRPERGKRLSPYLFPLLIQYPFKLSTYYSVARCFASPSRDWSKLAYIQGSWRPTWHGLTDT